MVIPKKLEIEMVNFVESHHWSHVNKLLQMADLHLQIQASKASYTTQAWFVPAEEKRD